ncbi:unnamed protein product [Chrysoparadoxa australica]
MRGRHFLYPLALLSLTLWLGFLAWCLKRVAANKAEAAAAAAALVPWDYQTKWDPLRMIMLAERKSELHAPPEGICKARKEKVYKDSAQLLQLIEPWEGGEKSVPKILCLVYTYHKNQDNVRAIKETWASRCNGILVFSDEDDESIPTHRIKHIGEEVYHNIWQKNRAIWKHVHHWYKDDFDWFLISGDDTYFIMENMRKFLQSEEITAASKVSRCLGQAPMYLGRRVKWADGDGILFNAGSAGYILNRKALGILNDNIDDARCQAHVITAKEDVQVARCLALGGVLPHDTRDALGRERFHPFTPGKHFSYRIPYFAFLGIYGWYPRYAIDLKEGPDCCAPDSVSFHYITADMMVWLYHQLYSCQ